MRFWTCTFLAVFGLRFRRSSWHFIGDGSPAGPALERRVREVVHAILAMAEYQLC